MNKINGKMKKKIVNCENNLYLEGVVYTLMVKFDHGTRESKKNKDRSS
jgi:hypothetical protein